MEIKITDYLNQDEIREVLVDELRNQIRRHFQDEKNAQRLLSNLSYEIVSQEVEKLVPGHQEMISQKVAKLITEKDLSFHLYNFDIYGGGKAKSLGAKIIEQTVEENRQIIKAKVVESIQSADYSEQALIKLENLSETFATNIYEFVDLMKTKR